MSAAFSNHEIVTLAVYLLGGDCQYVETEDAAVKANEIAPGRFSWRKYPDQISIDAVRKRLWDARKQERGAYVIGSEREGWLLTEAGLKFAKKGVVELEGADLSRKPFSQRERQWVHGERARMLSSQAFSKFLTGGTEAVSQQEAEGFFRVDDYVTGKARKRKITRFLNTFGEDPELGEAVRRLAIIVQGG